MSLSALLIISQSKIQMLFFSSNLYLSIFILELLLCELYSLSTWIFDVPLSTLPEANFFQRLNHEKNQERYASIILKSTFLDLCLLI